MSTNGHNGHAKNGNGHAKNGNGAHPINRIELLADRLPPQNVEVEASLLSVILAEGSILKTVRPKVAAADFWRVDHQVIYRAMIRLDDQAKPVDFSLIYEELCRANELEGIGGIETLRELAGKFASPANAEYYADVVRSKAVRRAVIERAEKVTREGYDDTTSEDELVANAQEQFATVEIANVPDSEAISVCLADVEAESVEWLWPGRVPKGMLALLAGDPELGKSFISYGIAAAVSVGAPWPDSNGECAPLGSSILLTAEDSLKYTVRARLDAAGADPSKIHALTMIKTRSGRKHAFSLANDIPQLEALIIKLKDVRFVVIDPVSSYLGGTDEHKNSDIRGLLSPLKELAERHGIAVWMVTHLNKGAGTKALYRATGSLAFVAAARIAWLVIKDPSDRTRRLMVNAKCNIAANPSGMAYRIVDGVIQWEATPIDKTADEALSDEAKKPERAGAGSRGPIPAKTRDAMDWIRRRLAHGPERHGNLRKASEGEQIATQTFYNALDRLEAVKFDDENGKKWIRLSPEAQAEAKAEIDAENAAREDDEPPLLAF